MLAFSLAFRDYFKQQGYEDTKTIQMCIPFSIRQLPTVKSDLNLRNEIALVPLRIPLHDDEYQGLK